MPDITIGTGEKYGPERKNLHKKILSEIIDCPPTESPYAVFIGGGAAAGKSTIRDKVIIPWLNTSLVVIDADIIKSRLGLNGDSESTSIQIHKESKYIAHQAIYLCLKSNRSFIYDSSLAAPPDEYRHFISLAKKASYQLIIIGVYTPEDIAFEREKTRCKIINRKVPERIFHYFHQQFPVTFMTIEKEFDLMRIYDNSFKDSWPRLIAERDRSGLKIINQKKYDEFMQKAAGTK